MILDIAKQTVAPEVRRTSDNSMTLYRTDVGECYHSVFGARTESEHIFLRMGLDAVDRQQVRILEVGLGTGLNLALTAADARGRHIDYHAVELYPIATEAMQSYAAESDDDLRTLLLDIHSAPWGEACHLTTSVTLTKHLADISDAELPCDIDVVYFDAFSPERQPEMWTVDIFERIYAHMVVGGVLATYCSKGIVKRALAAAGFRVVRLPGPPGKRHILQAWK